MSKKQTGHRPYHDLEIGETVILECAPTESAVQNLRTTIYQWAKRNGQKMTVSAIGIGGFQAEVFVTRVATLYQSHEKIPVCPCHDDHELLDVGETAIIQEYLGRKELRKIQRELCAWAKEHERLYSSHVYPGWPGKIFVTRIK